MPNGTVSLGLFAEFVSKVVSRLPRDLSPQYVRDLVDKPSRIRHILERAFAPASSSDDIMQRLLVLSHQACVRMRKNFPAGPSKWYVHFGPVAIGCFTNRNWSMLDPQETSGASPEEALANAWRYILAESQETDRFFLIYDLPSHEAIPGDGPQVWVRWNEEKDAWDDDFLVSTETLSVHQIPADRIHSLAGATWRHDPQR